MSVTAAEQSSASVIRIEQLHIGLWDKDLAHRKLEILERLLTSGKTLEVHSDVNPMHYFTMASRDHFRGFAKDDPDLARWAAVFAKFTRSREPMETNGEKAERAEKRFLSDLVVKRGDLSPAPAALRHLAAECWSDPRLRAVAERMARHPDLHEMPDRDHVINQLLDQVETYYRLLWSVSGKDERMVLHRIGQEGFVSWRSRELVRRLVHRGLIRMAPNPELMNESFRRFVLRAELPEVFQKWAAEEGASAWARLRNPISFAILATLVFLFATQPQLFNQSLAFTTALAAMAPALVRLVALLLQPRVTAGTRG